MLPTFFKTARTASEARTEINIVERAKRLWADGYHLTVNTVPTAAPTYWVYSPKGERHEVDLLIQECTCKAFEHYGDCKHRIAVATLVADAEDCEMSIEAYEQWRRSEVGY